jgi:hypothetical protein
MVKLHDAKTLISEPTSLVRPLSKWVNELDPCFLVVNQLVVIDFFISEENRTYMRHVHIVVDIVIQCDK